MRTTNTSQVLGAVLALIVASLVVLFIMNPNGFSSAIKSLIDQTGGESQVLTGSGYRKAV